MKYTDIRVYGDVYVSSSFDYFARVRYSCGGKVHRRDVWINSASIEYENGLGSLKIPRYFQRELERQIVALLKDPTTRFHEYDRDGNKRYEDLRYFDADYVAAIIRRLDSDQAAQSNP
jgi:hypothetical protein